MAADGSVGLEEVLRQTLAQGERVAALTERAFHLRRARRVREADRVWHTMQASYTFRQAENLTQPLIFNIPKGHSFEAHRLTLLVEMRLISIQDADGDSEITFRPTLWTHQVNEILNGLLGSYAQVWPVFSDRLVDANLELVQVGADGITPHEYQNAPFPVAQTYSGSVNTDTAGGSMASARPSALVFGVPMLLAPGTALQVRVSPSFSGLRTTDSRLNEYRVVGLLEGFKRLTQ